MVVSTTGRKIATGVPVTSTTSPPPIQDDWGEALGYLRKHNTSSGYWGSVGISGAFQMLRTPFPITFSHKDRILRPRGPGHTSTDNKVHFTGTQQKFERPKQCRRLIYHLLGKNNNNNPLLNLLKERSLLIIIFFQKAKCISINV